MGLVVCLQSSNSEPYSVALGHELPRLPSTQRGI
jgi:hypothetical protein